MKADLDLGSFTPNSACCLHQLQTNHTQPNNKKKLKLFGQTEY